MVDIWDTAERILFERGVALHRDQMSNWQCESAVAEFGLPPEEFSRQFGLRPVTASFRWGSALSYTLVFPSHRGKALNVQLSEIQQAILRAKRPAFSSATRSLIFLLYAAIYHCERLAHQCVKTVAQQIRFPHHADADRVMTHCYEGFFEFDALVTSVIRAVDSTRYTIWRAYGGEGSVPNSFRRTVDRCAELPDSFRQLVESLWNKRLSHAKEYRDCIQHYVAIGVSSGAMLIRVDGVLWTVWLRIPDNPEVRSSERFMFERGLDAMTYGWGLVSDLFRLTASLVQSAIADGREVTK